MRLRSGWNTNPTTDAKTIGVMETLDGLGYITTGFSFLLIAMVVFAHSWYVFILSVRSQAVPSVLALVHDLLLVIILLELFRTIINFLKTKVITLEPCLVYLCHCIHQADSHDWSADCPHGGSQRSSVSPVSA